MIDDIVFDSRDIVMEIDNATPGTITAISLDGGEYDFTGGGGGGETSMTFLMG